MAYCDDIPKQNNKCRALKGCLVLSKFRLVAEVRCSLHKSQVFGAQVETKTTTMTKTMNSVLGGKNLDHETYVCGNVCERVRPFVFHIIIST